MGDEDVVLLKARLNNYFDFVPPLAPLSFDFIQPVSPVSSAIIRKEMQ